MEYSKTYRTNCKITLDSGIEIIMEEFFQDRIYSTILEGVPKFYINDDYIEGYKKNTAELISKRISTELKPFFIEPLRYKDKHGFDEGSGIEFLPEIFCRAFFKSTKSEDLDMFGSRGCIIWFQDFYALPIQEDVLRKIKKMDWFEYSSDFE